MEEIFSVVKQRNATIDQRDAEIGTLTIEVGKFKTENIGLKEAKKNLTKE